MGKFFNALSSFVFGGDPIPFVTDDLIAMCQRTVDARALDDHATEQEKLQLKKHLQWSLMHSKHPEDVERAMAMVEASLNILNCEHQELEKYYLLAVGYYRRGDFSKSMMYIHRCLQVHSPSWDQPEILKKAIEDRLNRDSWIGIGIGATALGFVAGAAWINAARNK